MRLAMRQPVGEAERFLGRPDVAEGIFRAIAEQYHRARRDGVQFDDSGTPGTLPLRSGEVRRSGGSRDEES